MNKTLAAAAVAAPAALAAGTASQLMSVTHTGTLHLEGAPQEVFPLFTAPGERLWVPGWDPVILAGSDGLARGSVWLTGDGEEQTIWLVVDYDPSALHARYARITPGSRAGTVEVSARAGDSGGTRVEVTYQLTALNERGNEVLAEFDEDAYADMMVEWQRLIQEAEIEYPLRFAESESKR